MPSQITPMGDFCVRHAPDEGFRDQFDQGLCDQDRRQYRHGPWDRKGKWQDH